MTSLSFCGQDYSKYRAARLARANNATTTDKQICNKRTVFIALQPTAFHKTQAKAQKINDATMCRTRTASDSQIVAAGETT